MTDNTMPFQAINITSNHYYKDNKLATIFKLKQEEQESDKAQF